MKLSPNIFVTIFFLFLYCILPNTIIKTTTINEFRLEMNRSSSIVVINVNYMADLLDICRINFPQKRRLMRI